MKRNTVKSQSKSLQILLDFG